MITPTSFQESDPLLLFLVIFKKGTGKHLKNDIEEYSTCEVRGQDLTEDDTWFPVELNEARSGAQKLTRKPLGVWKFKSTLSETNGSKQKLPSELESNLK